MPSRRKSLCAAGLAPALLGLAMACSSGTQSTGEVAVTTAYATGANFSRPIVAVVSQVAVAVDGASQPTISYASIPAITSAVASNFQIRGYTVVSMDPGTAPPAGASYVAETTALKTSTVWYPCYWWGWWGFPETTCAYGWSPVDYSTGSLLLTMTDVTCLAAASCATPPAAIWMGLADAALPSTDPGASVSLAVAAINQAFDQSPYVSR